MSHINNGNCSHCLEIMETYAGFHEGLWMWFQEFQSTTPEAHISCAGRGKVEQESDFSKGVSKAHYGESAHNHNAAIDIFRLLLTGADWDRIWFETVMAPSAKNAGFEWGGDWRGSLGDYPHIEAPEWESLPLVE